MSPVSFGLLCALPLALLFTLRYARLRSRMAVKARRTFLLKAGAFLVLSIVVTGMLHAHQGALPLPLFWNLLLVVSAAALLLGFLKRS